MIGNGEVQWSDVEAWFGCKQRTVMDRFKSLGIESRKMKRGRPVKEVPERVVNSVMEYRSDFNTGYKRTAQAMVRDLQTPMLASSRTVYKVFKEHELFASRRHAPAQHDKRFVASSFGQLWHRDLHYYRVEPGEDFQYLIAFIDDRSRAIIHWELVADKTMVSASNALERALATQNAVVPYMMTIDNGG
jgi:transposase InsO family protein